MQLSVLGAQSTILLDDAANLLIHLLLLVLHVLLVLQELVCKLAHVFACLV